MIKNKKRESFTLTIDYTFQTKHLREFVSSTLFNSYYLEKGYPEKIGINFIPRDEDNFQIFYKKFIGWAMKQDEAFFTKIQPSETTTIDRYIMPIMTFLGWDNYNDGCSELTNRETAYHYGENIYKPDIIYFNNAKDAQKVDKLKKHREEQKLHTQKNHSLILEAKKFGLLKNKSNIADDKKNDCTKDRTPEEQTVLYMDMLHGKFAVLTDGGIWKFFHSEFRDKDKSFSFDLGKLSLLILRVSKFEDLDISLDSKSQKVQEINFLISYFYNIFSFSALCGNLGTVDHLLEYTKKYSVHLEDKMKDRFIMAMNWACNGLIKALELKGEKAEDHLNLIQKTAESHLFNIIFFRSLESRGILPYYDEDNDYRKYSISKTVDEIYKNGFNPSENFQKQLNLFSEYYDQRVEKKTTVISNSLVSLYKKVHSGYKDFKIEGFKESVFSTEEWDFATKYMIDDQHMMNVIFYLSLIPRGDRELGEYQLIPFDFLSPREIGSIYESFLEFKIEKAECDLFWNFKSKQWVTNRKNIDDLFVNEVLRKGEYVFSPNNHDRKMSGAYYTPHYIVEYIVETTLAEICKNKKPAEILKIKVCDPAMGSGHFISFALDYLTGKYLDAHYKYDIPLLESYGEIKNKILKSSIFGVDVNPSATKLAKMSLWLNTAKDSEKLLSLDKQIKQGDSLLGFKWKKEFSCVFETGGFDCIVGNPPYVRREYVKDMKNSLKEKYLSFDSDADLCVYFVEEGVNLLNSQGKLSYIMTNKWMRSEYGKNLRHFILDKSGVEEIVDFKDLPVFDGVSTYPMIIRLGKNKKLKLNHAIVQTLKFENLADYLSNKFKSIAPEQLSEKSWNFGNKKEFESFNLIESQKHTIGEIISGKILCGLKTGLNSAFIISASVAEEIIKKNVKSSILLRPFLTGREIKKYSTPKALKYIISIPKGWTDQNIPGKDKWKGFQFEYSEIAEHLFAFKNEAMKRSDKGDYWWELRACDYYKALEEKKIVFPDISKDNNFILEQDGQYVDMTAFVIPSDSLLLLGILNSSLVQGFIAKTSPEIRGGYFRWKKQYVAQIPFPFKSLDEVPVKFKKEIEANVKQILLAKTTKEQKENCIQKINDQVILIYKITTNQEIADAA